MKKLFFAGLLFYCATGFGIAPTPGIDEVRALYQKAATNEKSCKELVDLLSVYDQTNPLLLGYKASGTMMMAKYVFNPFSKLSYFKKGKQLLEKAIKTDENNFELRFLRFAAQTNIPAFLGYNDDIQADKAFILKTISYTTDIKLKEFVFPFLTRSKYLNDEEKKGLK